jgi:hypothetical protein
MGYRGMGFVSSSGNFSFEGLQQIVQNIPCESIIVIGSTVFTIYGYVKFLTAVYRYLNSRISPKIDNSKLIRTGARVLIDSINKTEYMKRVDKIYKATLKMEYSRSL